MHTYYPTSVAFQQELNTLVSMSYTVLYENPEETIFERLMKIRNISDSHEEFLNPSYKTYRQDPIQLNDIDKAIERVKTAIDAQEKIMIFWDYDVDGIMSSYIMYTFFRKYLWYHNISIRLPHRTKDGYGIKKHHIDQIKADWCSLIITVDNWITSVAESIHATEIGLDMIITDHHQALETLPTCCALINPQVSPEMRFKDICWATVALKVCCAFADALWIDQTTKRTLLEEFLPFASMATIADCMPLVDENRLIVKKGLETMNTKRESLSIGLRTMLDHLKIKKVDTFHIWFQIGPRLNATWRVWDAIDGLKTFLFSDKEKIIKQCEYMESLNVERKKIQDTMTKRAKELIDPEQMLLFAADEIFHEWIVWIVAGRVAEKHYKPAIIMRIDEEKWLATGSLRWPDYFNIIEMLNHAEHLLERYGGHEQAWWATVKLENLQEFQQSITEYCNEVIAEQSMEKTFTVDTKIYASDFQTIEPNHLAQLWPYGIWNPEPMFAAENILIEKISTMWKSEKTHLKLQGQLDWQAVTIIQRWKWELSVDFETWQSITVIGKIKPDTFNGGFFIDTKKIL